MAADEAGMTMGMSVMRWEPKLLQGGDAGQAPRRGASNDAEIVLPGRGLKYTAQVVALHGAGCVLETRCRLEAGTAVEVWLRTEGMPLRMAATLGDRTARGVEFSFQPMPSRKQEQIQMLRRELGLEGSGTGPR